MNYPEFNRVEKLLVAQGHEVINPASNPNPPAGTKKEDVWAYFMELSLEQVRSVEKLVLLQGWEASRGARKEVALALDLKLDLEPHLDEPDWIVNDLGELGVRIHGRCYFCYKGYSLEYTEPVHGDGTPILYRTVGKREFGETVWPMEWITAGRRTDRYTLELVYTEGLSDGKADDPDYHWNPLPTYKEE